ncbi:hypothetical protein GbCGDNIH7_10007 [Granulibacter bethesdensis]|nr:hypothetical protein GbCGDNIH7_10007 [Granulibacter bethesdensis]
MLPCSIGVALQHNECKNKLKVKSSVIAVWLKIFMSNIIIVIIKTTKG